MNEAELIDALVKRLERLFYGHPFLNRKGDSQELSPVKVCGQYIPQSEGITVANHESGAIESYTENDFMNNFPCVVVKLIDRTDNEERSMVMSELNVKLIAGVYDESPVSIGYRDVMNMMSMMRDDFREDRFIEQRFRVLMPLKSRMIESDTWPVTYGEIDLKLETGRKLEPREYIYRGGLNNDRNIYEGVHSSRTAG